MGKPIKTNASKAGFMAENGPFKGKFIAIATNGDGKTAIFTVGSQTGRYVNGKWEKINATEFNDSK